MPIFSIKGLLLLTFLLLLFTFVSPVHAQTPSIDLKANGSNGPLTLKTGDPLNLTWTTTNNPLSCTGQLLRENRTIDSDFYWSKRLPASGGSQSYEKGYFTEIRNYIFRIYCSDSELEVATSDEVRVNFTRQGNCTTNSTCGFCTAPANTCGTNNGTQKCLLVGDGLCTPVESYVPCTIKNCSSGYSCQGGQCISSVQAPTVNLLVNNGNGPITLNSGGSTTLSWTTTNNPTSCNTSGSWTGGKSISGGSENTPSLSSGTYTYSISCSNSAGSASDSVTVNVNRPAPQQPPVPQNPSIRSQGSADHRPDPELPQTAPLTVTSVQTGCDPANAPSNSPLLHTPYYGAYNRITFTPDPNAVGHLLLRCSQTTCYWVLGREARAAGQENQLVDRFETPVTPNPAPIYKYWYGPVSYNPWEYRDGGGYAGGGWSGLSNSLQVCNPPRISVTSNSCNGNSPAVTLSTEPIHSFLEFNNYHPSSYRYFFIRKTPTTDWSYIGPGDTQGRLTDTTTLSNTRYEYFALVYGIDGQLHTAPVNTASVTTQDCNIQVSCSADKTSAEVNQEVRWTAASTGGVGGRTYVWAGEGLDGQSGERVTTRYSSPGDKQASVRVITAGGQTATNSCSNNVNITLGQPPTIQSLNITQGPPGISSGFGGSTAVSGRLSDQQGSNWKNSIDVQVTADDGSSKIKEYKVEFTGGFTLKYQRSNPIDTWNAYVIEGGNEQSIHPIRGLNIGDCSNLISPDTQCKLVIRSSGADDAAARWRVFFYPNFGDRPMNTAVTVTDFNSQSDTNPNCPSDGSTCP